ncbi:MAG: hypothetical protein ACYDIE_02190 [Candidatus Krumholzibacteriia bacterium]
MESHPNPRDAWVKDAERWICQIHGVRQCKVDLDGHGEVSGVHVVAGMEREARHVVRDVEGLLKARLGLSVFYKKIGVVQVVDNEQDEAIDEVEEEAEEEEEETGGVAAAIAGAQRPDLPLEAVLLEEAVPPRIQLGGVGLLATDRTVKAEVELRAGLLEARGQQEGVNTNGSDLVLVARAAVDAVRQLIIDPVTLTLADLQLTEVAGETVILAAVELTEGRRSERLYGTCSGLPSRSQGAVYAVLDALNRRVSLLSFRNADKGGVELTS